MQLKTIILTVLLLIAFDYPLIARQPNGPTTLSSLFPLQRTDEDSSNETMYRANLQRTGVYKTRGVPKLNKIQVLSAKLFKVEREKAHSWGDWYEFGGQSVYLGGEYKIRTGMDFSPPIFAGNIIYFKIDNVNHPKSESYLYAVDATSGQMQWNLKNPNSIFSLPSVSNGIVYVGAGNGVFYALDPLAKKVKWSSSSGDKSSVVTSPLVTNQGVFFGSNNGMFYALNKLTGQTLWEYDTTGQDICETPAVSGDTIYFCAYSGNLYALNILTGREKWKAQFKRGAISLVVADNTVYFRNGEGYIQAVDANTGKQVPNLEKDERAGTDLSISDKTIYFSGWSKGNVFAIDAETLQRRWKFNTDGPCNSPVIAERMIYVTCSDNKLYALDSRTGEKLWETKAYKSALSEPVIAEGVIYFISEDGYLHAVR